MRGMSEETSPGPAPAGLDPAAWSAHHRACLAGEAGYMDPATGLFSPTSTFLRERGHCCGCGCRHCPYSLREQQAAGRLPKPCFPWEPAV